MISATDVHSEYIERYGRLNQSFVVKQCINWNLQHESSENRDKRHDGCDGADTDNVD